MFFKIVSDWFVTWGVIAISLSLYYIIFSLGIVLTFGMHKVINFAHGALYMVGAYFGYVAYSVTGSFIFALLLSFIGPFFLGALLERFLISRLYGSDPTITFLITFALSFILIGIVKLLATVQYRSIEIPELLARRIFIGDLYIDAYRLFFMVFTILILILMNAFLTKTKVGSIVRAGTFNSTAVEVLGINVNNYFTLTFGIGSGLAGLCGVLFAPLFTAIYPTMGDGIILWGFVVVIIGGLGNFYGSIVGGIILGILHSFGSLILREYVLLFTYAIMIIILIVRPQGIFGGRE